MTQQIPHMRPKSNHQIIEGIIHIHAKGFGFVTPSQSNGCSEDVFIPKHLKKNAVDGDLVEIAVKPDRKKDKGPEGYVLSVVKRAKTHLVGIVWMINPKGHYLLYVQSLGNTKAALVKRAKQLSYEVGDCLLLEVIDWGEENTPALCTVKEKIGCIRDTTTDIKAAIKDFDIRFDFPASLSEEVEQLPKEVSESELTGRLDLTMLETFTIDPATARDYDDALSLSKDREGYHLGVHIADVSHYVKAGSKLDAEARKRSNSTYFPGVCVPMLPEALSNHLCSLKEKKLRLSVSVLIDFDREGTVTHSRIEKAYIFSQKRFTYEEAKEILDQKRKSPHFSSLKLMKELCLLLKKKRFQRGSVDLSLPEVVIQVDKKGSPYGVEVFEYDHTHQLVEEFMLKANEIVAKHFITHQRPTIFRVHEDPSPENLEEFYFFARTLGFSVPGHPKQEDIQALFTAAKKTPHLQRLSIAFIRSMKMAFYCHRNTGHFGLALEHYCHFTSPIRRYSDLVVHRLLFDHIEIPDLKEIAQSCSEKERISFKAESSVILMKKVRLLASYQKKDPQRGYRGVISKIKPFGFSFEAEPLQIEGFIHISDISDDYYAFDPKTQILVGQQLGHSFKMGDFLKVSLIEVDLITLDCKWRLIREVHPSQRGGIKKHHSGKKRNRR